jgi:hypothetical protein
LIAKRKAHTETFSAILHQNKESSRVTVAKKVFSAMNMIFPASHMPAPEQQRHAKAISILM